MRGSLVVAAVAAIALTGCGQKDESKTVRTEGGGTVTTETHSDGSHTYTVTDDKGGGQVTIGAGASGAMTYPAYAPAFPGAKVMSTISASGKPGGMVIFHADAAPAAVVAFYKKAATGAGLADLLNMQSGTTQSYSAINEKTHDQMTVVAAKTDDGTQVQLTWGKS
jgi:hypothetical protein